MTSPSICSAAEVKGTLAFSSLTANIQPIWNPVHSDTNISSIWTFPTTSIHCPLVVAHLDYHNSFLNVLSLLTFVCLEPSSDKQPERQKEKQIYNRTAQLPTAFTLVEMKFWQWPTKPITIWFLGLLRTHLLYIFSSLCSRTVAFKYTTSMPMSFCIGCILCMKILTPGLCMAGSFTAFTLWFNITFLFTWSSFLNVQSLPKLSSLLACFVFLHSISHFLL